MNMDEIAKRKSEMQEEMADLLKQEAHLKTGIAIGQVLICEHKNVFGDVVDISEFTVEEVSAGDFEPYFRGRLVKEGHEIPFHALGEWEKKS